MELDHIALTRHTCKAYDPSRRIPDELWLQLKSALHYAPSSVNSQPWHYVFAATEAAKQRIAKATAGPYSANTPKILNASHVVVFCARTTIDDTYLATVTAQEDTDRRFPTPDARAAQLKSKLFYTNLHRFDYKDTQHWMEKQVYLSLGFLLLGAATLGIDATPIEGFDPHILNDELNLRSQGLTSVVIATLGYRSDQDFNATLPKSRFPEATVFTEL